MNHAMSRRGRLGRVRLLTTSALGTLVLVGAPSSGAAQSCTSTPPDNNCIIYMALPPAGPDDTGASTPDVGMTFSPPTSFNGDTHDAGIRFQLEAGNGGDATSHGETGGTGGNGGNLTLVLNNGTSVEGSTPQGAISLFTAGGNGGQAYYGANSQPYAASGGTGGVAQVTLGGTVTASGTDAAIAAQSMGGDGGAGHDGGVGEYAANGGTGGAGQGVTITQTGSVSNATGGGVTLSSVGGDGFDGATTTPGSSR